MRFVPSTVLAIATTLSLSSPADAQSGRNEKHFYTPIQVQAVRQNPNAADYLYFMPDENFHRGYGRATGFRAVLQDQDQSTAELVQFGFVKSAGGHKPDVSATGLLANARVSLFGVGTGAAAYEYTVTLSKPQTITENAGLRIVIPAANNWSTDGVTIHYQNGNQIKLPSGVTKRQYTHYLNGSAAAAFSTPASLLDLAALYEEPVSRHFVRSTVYGLSRDLFGPESIWLDSTRGDRIGWSVSGDTFPFHAQKSLTYYLVMLSGNYSSSATVTPFGNILLNPAPLIYLPPLPLDSQGNAKTITVPVPKGVTLASQAIFFDFTKQRIRLSGATRFFAR